MISRRKPRLRKLKPPMMKRRLKLLKNSTKTMRMMKMTRLKTKKKRRKPSPKLFGIGSSLMTKRPSGSDPRTKSKMRNIRSSTKLSPRITKKLLLILTSLLKETWNSNPSFSSLSMLLMICSRTTTELVET